MAAAKQDSAKIWWDFRITASEEFWEGEKELIEEWMKQCNSLNHCFQLERGDEGQLHFQGRVQLEKRKRFTTLINEEHCPWDWNEHDYLYKTVTKNIGDWSYFEKEKTRIAGPWKLEAPPFIQNKFKERVWWPCQNKIMEKAKDFSNDRRITLILGPGNDGKSDISAYMSQIKMGIYVPPIFETSLQMMQWVSGFGKFKNLFIDMPRTMETRHLKKIFTTIEVLRGGFMMDTRYKTKGDWQEPPNVFLMWNIEEWDENYSEILGWLSIDRWEFYQIIEKDLIEIKYEKKEKKKGEKRISFFRRVAGKT